MTEKEVLEKARELLTPEGAWVQGAHARDVGGERCFSRDPEACQWCLVGAVSRVAHNSGEYRWILPSLDTLARVGLGVTPGTRDPRKPGQILVKWNDHPKRTHAEVLALLDRAIAA